MTTKTKLTPEMLEEMAEDAGLFFPEATEPLHLLAKILRGSEPVAYQFFDKNTGEWGNYMNEAHRKSTVEAGYTERALYASPKPDNRDARIAEVVPDESNRISINAGLFKMLTNALQRDADTGLVSRREMLEELTKDCRAAMLKGEK